MERLAIFTAIDGTLLDPCTFDPGAARPLLHRLSAMAIPVVPVTVMTLEELAPLAAELGMRHAMIVEAGGAIARWKNDAWEVEPFGPPADALLDVIAEIEERSGANLLVYSALPDADAARVSGRSGEMLRASTHRAYSEPFLLESGELDAVIDAAAAIGFSIRRGRRFLHLCRESREGEAFARIREELRCDVAIGAGGSPVDAGFLAGCDVAIIVPRPDGEPDAELLSSVPRARVAPAPGPEGWAAAIDDAIVPDAVRRLRR